MKASEMTNEQLSKKLKRYITKSVAKEWPAYAETILDAAARLRNVDDYAEMCGDAMKEVAALRAKLKLAEDALDACLNYNNAEELRKAERKAKNALAAIREEGGANK